MGLFWHSGHRNIVLPAICIQGRAIPCAQLTDRNKCGEVRHHSHPCALIRLNGSGGSMTAQSAAERGAPADTAASITIAAWGEIAGRQWVNSGRAKNNLMAAGVKFYAFLSFVPLLGGSTMNCGLVARSEVGGGGKGGVRTVKSRW